LKVNRCGSNGYTQPKHSATNFSSRVLSVFLIPRWPEVCGTRQGSQNTG
jgi:hypothetical protein